MMIATLLLSSVTVTLSGDVVVGGTEISLGDVAQVSGEDAALVARLEGLSLGYAPAPGYTRVFPQWKIESLLRGEAPGQELELAGEAVCRVSPRTTRISGDALLAEARTAAQELLVGEDFELSTPEPLEDELVPEGRRGVELRAAAARATRVSASTAGRWSMPIEILVDGAPYRTVWVSLDVQLYRTVPVLVRDVAAGQELGVADVQERRVLVGGPLAERPLSAAQLAGARARRTLSRGTPVGAADVVRVAAVRRGETANLTVRNGGVLVNAKVIALEDAHVGELVAVRVLNSNKDLSAEVVGKGQLRLDLGTKN